MMNHYALGVLTASWIIWLWDIYLDYRQYCVYKSTEKVPKELSSKISADTFKKAKAYSIDKARFGFITSTFSQLQSTVTIYYFLMAYFWDLSRYIMSDQLGFSRSESVEWEIFQALVFTFITSLASTIVNLPFSIYSTFVLEQKHGFNKQTATFYAWDKFKMFTVSFIISTPIVATITYIARTGGPYFFLYLWLFTFLAVCLLTFFSGEIMAIFDKFTPLPSCELRDRIEKLAKDVGFPLSNIFIVEGSKRSSHSNAYQSGLFNKKRIVIYDTLIEGYYDKVDCEVTEAQKKMQIEHKGKGCNNDEIVAVLCHEIGHWYCSHLIKRLLFSQVNIFLIFLIFSRFYTDPILYAAFGFNEERPVIIGLALVMLILSPYQEVENFVSTLISRKFEYQADEYSAQRGNGDKLKTALVKLTTDNLSFPVHDELYSTFNHSHPTLIQRIKALSKFK